MDYDEAINRLFDELHMGSVPAHALLQKYGVMTPALARIQWNKLSEYDRKKLVHDWAVSCGWDDADQSDSYLTDWGDV